MAPRPPGPQGWGEHGRAPGGRHILSRLDQGDPGDLRLPILSVRELSVRFGGIVALDAVSFDLEPRQIVGLIGPNGAGKTTLFNCVSRLYTPSAGGITFDGTDLLSLQAHRIAALGIGRTFQNLALFPTMTVLQNVMIGAHSRT